MIAERNTQTRNEALKHVKIITERVFRGSRRGQCGLRVPVGSFSNFDLQFIDLLAGEDRCAARWELHWDLHERSRGKLREADFIRMKGDKIHEKLSYMDL